MAGESRSNSVVDDLIELSDRRVYCEDGPEVNFARNEVGSIMDTQAIDDQAHLANYDSDNEIENDDLGYHSEEYFDDAQRDYLSVTFDALNRISGKHRALFSSFLGDIVREHIGLKILAWNKVGSEARDKLWDEILRKLVMNRLGQLLRTFRTKLRRTYILPNQDTPSKLNEVPAKYTAILKAEEWVNFVKYTATQAYKVKSAAGKMARSKCLYPHIMGRGGYAHVKEKMKETEDNIKEGTLRRNQGTDAHDTCIKVRKGRLCIEEWEVECHTKEVSLVDIHPVNSSADKEGGTTVLRCDQNDASISERKCKREEATPPSTIQMITIENKTAPKVPTKRKNFYVSSDAMQKEANKKIGGKGGGEGGKRGGEGGEEKEGGVRRP
ncbi:hypothetical protein Tco_0483382 [Tanacetum coccineum]